MLVGATHIDHVDRLRAGATGAVLGFRPAAASTVGSFLRSFTWGHVGQLDKAAGEVLGRAWAAGGGPGNSAMTIDVDSTVCEVFGETKAGAAYGHTEHLCYHPLVGVRAESGEILATRLRKGSSQSGNVHFVAETVARARRAGAAGELTLRADSGFFSYDLLDRLDALKVRWSVTIPQYAHVKAAAGGIDEDDWAPIAYTDSGEAHVADTTLPGGRRANKTNANCASWCGAAASATRPNNNSGPTGATTPSSPTEPTSTPPPPTPITAPTPPSNWPSVTSRTAPAWRTCRRGVSPPTPPDSPAPHSPTTSTAGSTTTPVAAATANSPSDKPSATNSSLYPGASSTTPDAPSCASPPDGPRHPPSTPPWRTSAPCPNSAEPANHPDRSGPPPAPRAPKRPQALPAPPTAPTRRHKPPQHPTNSHTQHPDTTPHPKNTTQPTPIGGFRVSVLPTAPRRLLSEETHLYLGGVRYP